MSQLDPEIEAELRNKVKGKIMMMGITTLLHVVLTPEPPEEQKPTVAKKFSDDMDLKATKMANEIIALILNTVDAGTIPQAKAE